MPTPQTLHQYKVRLRLAATTLVNAQDHSGGWGRALHEQPSIVNTVEALMVLTVADNVERDVIDYGLSYLARSLLEHYRPTSQVGGRGERIRFIAFYLQGVLQLRAHNVDSEAIDRVRRCLQWLAESFLRLKAGWPETRGESAISIQQTARIVAALSMLLQRQTEYGFLRNADVDTAVDLLHSGVNTLLEKQTESGAWPAHVGEDAPTSPAKTALAITSLGYAQRFATNDELRSTLDKARRHGAGWLVQQINAWSDAVEDDGYVLGTTWRHLSYAECMRGVVDGFESPPEALQANWKSLVRRWSESFNFWLQPGNPDGVPTIPATHHTVMAFESLQRDRSSLIQPAPLLPSPNQDPVITEIKIPTTDTLVIRVSGIVDPFQVRLTERQHQLASLLLANERGTSASHLANTMGIVTNSVPQYVRRLNGAVSAASRGQIGRMVMVERITNGETRYMIKKDPTHQDG